jgi:hypothetical protein
VSFATFFSGEHASSPVSTTPEGECHAIRNLWRDESGLTSFKRMVREILWSHAAYNRSQRIAKGSPRSATISSNTRVTLRLAKPAVLVENLTGENAQLNAAG